MRVRLLILYSGNHIVCRTLLFLWRLSDQPFTISSGEAGIAMEPDKYRY